MRESTSVHNMQHDEEQRLSDARTVYGFWVYLMTDCILFGTLFAVYAVLHYGTFGGPSGQEIFNPLYVLNQTIALLTSSFTCGLAMLAAYKGSKSYCFIWLGITFLLGALFLTLELKEFYHLVEEGNSWERSAFLSSFFTLVGTHGAHITVGLLWIATLVGQILYRGFSSSTLRRLTCFSLFWHFLDIVWIFIFTLVYMMGVIS